MRSKVQLIGFIGQKPEQRTFAENKSATSISLATSENRKTKNGSYNTHTEWHKLKIWGKRGDYAAQKLDKGDEIAVDGRLHYFNYEGKNGNKIYGVEIIVENIMLIRKKNIA